MPPPAPLKLRCRLIVEADLDGVAALLEKGFGPRKRQSWRCGLERLASRTVPEGLPRFGYCLMAGDTLAGVILLIVSERRNATESYGVANVASWYVLPEYRAYAQMLVSMALKNKTLTYLNVSAAPHTWAIVESQGYQKYCNGLFVTPAAMLRPARGVEVIEVTAGSSQEDLKTLADYPLLRRHAAWGCTALVMREGARLTPMVFRRFTIRRGRLPLPAMFVLHAPDRAALVRYAGNVGRYFVPCGAPFLVMDALGKVEGLPGRYDERRGRKFFKGPHAPALCDLADTEFAIFGL